MVMEGVELAGVARKSHVVDVPICNSREPADKVSFLVSCHTMSDCTF